MQFELQAEPPAWTLPARTPPRCYSEGSPIRGTFSATWGYLGLPQMAPGLALEAQVDGQPVSFPYLLSSAGGLEGQAAIRLIAADASSRGVLVQLMVEPSQFVGGQTVDFHGFETVGVVIRLLGRDTFRVIGFVGGGNIQLDRASMTRGEPVSGRFDGRFVQTSSVGL